MQIEVRLFAYLRDGRFKRQTMELPEATRLGDIVRQLEIPAARLSLALVNGQFSPMERQLQPRDVVSLFPPVAGG